jgi:hypothetical protein
VLSSGDTTAWDAFVHRHGTREVPLAALNSLVFRPLFKTRARLQAIETALGVLKAENARITKDLEARPRLVDQDVWRSGQSYNPGDLVSHHGSARVRRTAGSGEPGVDVTGWRLFCKRGRDGRNLR